MLSSLVPPAWHASLSRLWIAPSRDGVPPHKAIEQLSYLLMLLLNEQAIEHGPSLPTSAHWRPLVEARDDVLKENVQEAFAWLRQSRLCDPSLLQGAAFTITKPANLREVIDLLDEMFHPGHSREVLGLLYDMLLHLAEAAAAQWAAPGGKFYTPRHLAHLLCSLVCPRPGEVICDYACGNGRLLAAAAASLKRIWSDPAALRYAADGTPLPLDDEPSWTDEQRAQFAQTRLIGIDIDASAALQSWVLLRCLGRERSQILAGDTLSGSMTQQWQQDGLLGRCDVLLANPPYASAIDRAALDAPLRERGTAKAEVLFLARALHLLRPGGRMAIIVPDRVLFTRDHASVALRRELVCMHGLRAIISLPANAFAPYTGVKTSILVLTHSATTQQIWCYRVEHDGYTLDKRRRPTLEDNDLPDLAIKYGLSFSGTLSSCRPSAFINDDTELQWDNIAPDSYAYHYAQPILGHHPPHTGEEAPVPLLKGTMAMPVKQPKHWDIAREQLDEYYTLLPNRYQPCPRPTSSVRPQAFSRPKHAVHRQDQVQRILYVPEVKDAQTLAQWYQESLRALRSLHRQGQMNAKQHLASLLLLACTKSLQEEEFRLHPLQPGEVPLTPTEIAQSGGNVSSWFQGAIRMLERRIEQGTLSPERGENALQLLMAHREYVAQLIDLQRPVEKGYKQHASPHYHQGCSNDQTPHPAL